MKTDIGTSHEQISQGKRFILSWKVRENEFFRVVGTMFSARLSFISHISFVCLLYTIVSGSDGKLFLLIATSEFKEHKNALVAGAVPQTSARELFTAFSRPLDLEEKDERGEREGMKRKGVKWEKRKRERREGGKKIKTWPMGV